MNWTDDHELCDREIARLRHALDVARGAMYLSGSAVDKAAQLVDEVLASPTFPVSHSEHASVAQNLSHSDGYPATD